MSIPGEIELYQAARLLIDRFGEGGAIDHCDERIEDYRAQDDRDGLMVWQGIRVAVKNLVAGAPRPGDVVH